MHDSFRGNYPEAEDGGTARKAVACQGAPLGDGQGFLDRANTRISPA